MLREFSKVVRMFALPLLMLAPTVVACAAAGEPAKQMDQIDQKAAPESVAEVLIYSDQSPGALPDGLVWQQVVRSRGERAILVTDPVEFGQLLPTRDWADVIIAARYAPGQPVYAEALREYAQGHERDSVLMFIWHDNGTQPTADTVVQASRVIVLWNSGMTTTNYSGIANRAPEMSEARTTMGLHFPDFRGIELRNPRVITRLPDGAAAVVGGERSLIVSLIVFLTQSACEALCLKERNNRITACDKDRDTHVQECNDLYGATEGDPGDFDAWQECRALANTNQTNCLSAAGDRYNTCMAFCAPGPAEPADDGG